MKTTITPPIGRDCRYNISFITTILVENIL
jgi:hypothetical protein